MILIDTYGNKGEYLNKGILKINQTKTKVPSRVTELRAMPDDQKIRLNWDTITDHILPVIKYRIYYGESATYLNQIVETQSSTPNWYISNLENGKTYYFAVTGIDNQNNESSEKSLIVNAIPVKAQALVRAVASDSRVTLSWDEFGSNPVRYKVLYGVQSGQYIENVQTKNNQTTWYIPDLINGVTYYFQVVPLDALGQLQTPSPEASATPSGSGFHPVASAQSYVLPQTSIPQGETGPEVWILILSSLFLVDILLRFRKRIIQ